MGLCRLTLTWGPDEPVYINTDNIISVTKLGKGTQVTTTGAAENGPYTIVVTEQPEKVVELVMQASRS